MLIRSPKMPGSRLAGAPLLVAYMLKHYGDRGAGDLYRRGVRAGFTIEPTTSYWCDASGVEVTGRKILITRYRNLVINWQGPAGRFGGGLPAF